jgi:hypothetical protein
VTKTYTAGEVAAAIAEPGENIRVIGNRLRTWTVERLLRPVDEAKGTGYHLRYPARTLIDAAILSQLTKRYGLWAKKAPLFTSQLLDLAVKHAAEPSVPGQTIYLVACADPIRGMIANVQVVGKDRPLVIPPKADDAFVINLTRLYTRLRGK